MQARYIGLLGAAALGAAVLVPGVASAADAVTNQPTVMREGPASDYRRVTVVPPGRHVDVYRCTRGRSWCEIGWRRFDGWVRGYTLDADFGYAPPPIYIEPPDIYIGPGPRHWDHGHRPPPPPPGMGHRPPPFDNGPPPNMGDRPHRGDNNGPPPGGDNGPPPNMGNRPHRGDNNGPPPNGNGGPPPRGMDNNRPPQNDGPPHRPPPCRPGDQGCSL